MFRRFVIIALLFLAMPLSAKAQVVLTNPLGTTDVRLIAANLIQGALGLSGTIALIMFIYGGIVWMTSAGNTEAITKGKKTLVWAILGIIIIMSAFVIVRTVFEAILTPTGA